MDSHNFEDKYLINFSTHVDSRGSLTVVPLSDFSLLPFEINRVFWISDVPTDAHRGKHAHRYCSEILVPVHGTFKVLVNDGKGFSKVYVMDNPVVGLIIPPLVWCELFDFSSDSVCLCLASGVYDKDGYISDFNDFLNTVAHDADATT